MPARPLRPCAAPGCGTLVEKGRCPTHAVQPDPRVGRVKKYDRQSWRGPHGVRIRKLRRDPLCETCAEQGRVAPAKCVDHIDGDAANDSPSNLRSLCTACHSRKTVAQDGGFGRKPGAGTCTSPGEGSDDRSRRRILASPKPLGVA